MAEFASRQSFQTLRNVGVADLPAVYDLYRAIEPQEDISAEHFSRWWRWLYADNPRRLSVVLGSFDGAGRNLGHLALLPIDFVIDGQHVLACSACQLMVAEDQRRTLLYPTLVRDFFKAYPANGCEFCYAEVTRPRVLAANLALGFRKIARLPVYARPYRLEKLARVTLGRLAGLFRPALWLGERVARLGVPLAGRRYTVSETARIPEDFGPFLRSVSGQFKLAALRTVPILNWRFAGNPDRGYRIFLVRDGDQPAGYIVVRRMPMREFDTLAVVDLLFDCTRPDVGHALLRRAHRLAVSEAVDIAVAMMSEHSPFRRVLRPWGFVESPEQFTLIIHEPKNARRTLAARPPEDWHVTWFDHDFV
jgi:hypothetical protein